MNRALVQISAVVLAAGAMGGAAPAGAPGIGLLVGQGPAGKLTPESHAAC